MDRPRGEPHVIATTDEETRTALAEAKRLAGECPDSRVVLLVPHLVSYSATLDPPRDAPAEITEHYRALAAEAGLDVAVRVCFCRHREDVFRWMLGRRALVVIGGRRRQWWPTAAQRMASRLIRDGHEVVFANADVTR